MIPAFRYSSERALPRSGVDIFSLRLNFTIPLILLAVLLSALSVIYASNETRNLNADIQRVKNDRATLHVEWEQLVLEKSALMQQSRIQRYAESHLDMVAPDERAVVDIAG